MSLKPCTDCGQPVSTKAPRCPNCGLKNPTVPHTDAPLLFSAATPGGIVLRCRECGGALRSTAKNCPFCGVQNPVRRRPPTWALVVGVLLLTVPAVGTVGWRVASHYRVALDVDSGRVHLTARRIVLDSEMVQLTARREQEVPRFRATGFPARCLTPAPVLVYTIGSVPTDVRVFVNARNDAEGDSLTGVLAKKYGLDIWYQRSLYAFDGSLSSDLVGKLRCESGVARIEQRRRDSL